MPIGDIAGEVLGGVGRFMGRIFFEVVFEFIIQGTGYMLLRLLRPKSEPSDTACAIVGLLFWIGAVVAGVVLYHHLAAA
ncbi:hypothetical protein [Pseudoxanthomonas wuyuanensis]